MTKLHLASNLALPLEIMTEPLAIVARRGRGKTYAAGKLAEEMLAAGQQVVVLDPMDVWWGLRTSADGKGDGFPVVIFGGEHADVALEASMGAQVADFLIAEHVPAVIVPDWEDGKDLVEFMVPLLNRLLHANREPMHVFVDEAETFAPERPAKYETPMLGAMNRLVKKGRVRGLGCTLVTQRTASLNKNALTQAAGILAMALSAPWDRAPVEAWMRTNGTPEEIDKLEAELASLPVGEGFFWHPEWDIFRRIRVAAKRTYDSSATPKPGQRRRAPKSWSEIDLEAVRGQLAEAVARAEAQDPERLQRRVRELETRLSNEGYYREKAEALGDAEQRIRDLEDQLRALEPERVEVPVLPRETAEAIRDAGREFGERLGAMLDEMRRALERMEQAARRDGQIKRTVVARPARTVGFPAPPDLERQRRADRQRIQEFQESRRDGERPARLRAGARRMVEVLARFQGEALTKEQLSTLSGVTRGGTFSDYLRAVLEGGFVQEAPGGRLVVTEEGYGHAGIAAGQHRPTTEELLNMYRPRLRAGARRMLDAVIGRYPDAITKEELSEKTGVTRGGTFSDYLRSLRTPGLVEVHGDRVVASDTLYMGR